MNLKTNKILLLAILCVASVSCVQLENICASDSFEYDGVWVNSFHRVQRNVTFGSLRRYLINDTVKCDPAEFKNKTNFWETLKFKHAYNRKFAGLYTENLIGNTGEEYGEKWQELATKGSVPLLIISEEEDKAKCVKSFQKTAFSGSGVFFTLETMNTRNCHPTPYEADFRPTINEANDMLENLLDRLKANTDGQTFAFKTERAYDVYWFKQVVVPREFKFLKEKSDRIGLDTESMLIYDELLPFNNQNHENGNCVSVQELPLFYKKKGIQ